MKKIHLYLAFFLFIIAIIGVIILVWHFQPPPYAKIQNFDDCVKAGYPVMQSYPPECNLPNGKFFVQQLVQ